MSWFIRLNTLLPIPLSLLFAIILIVISQSLYYHNSSARVYNTKNYALSFQAIGESHDRETFLFPYHIYVFNLQLSSKDFRIYCHILIYLYGFLILGFAGTTLGIKWIFIFTLCLVLSPVYLIQLNWIGFPEHLMFIFLGILMVILYSRDSLSYILFYPLFNLILVLGFWTHFYQFLATSFLILTVDSRFKKEYRLGIYVGFFCSLFLSRFLVQEIFTAHGVVSNYDRALLAFSKSPLYWYGVHIVQLPYTLWSLLYGLSFLVGYLLFFRWDPILWTLILICLGVTFFNYDTTRVFSNLFYPAFFYYLLLKVESESYTDYGLFLALLAIGFLAVLCIDPFYIWAKRMIPIR